MNVVMMDGKNGIIRNEYEFILILNEEFIGPIRISQHNVRAVYNALQDKGELKC